jgi:hypothetical protein
VTQKPIALPAWSKLPSCLTATPSERLKLKETKAIESARAVTWQTAADILRQTELHNAEWTNEPHVATASVNAATARSERVQERAE